MLFCLCPYCAFVLWQCLIKCLCATFSGVLQLLVGLWIPCSATKREKYCHFSYLSRHTAKFLFCFSQTRDFNLHIIALHKNPVDVSLEFVYLELSLILELIHAWFFSLHIVVQEIVFIEALYKEMLWIKYY